jgi:hypothetical protein
MDLTSVDTYSEKRPQAFQRKMAAGVGGLKLAFVLFGIFIRLAPTNELQNDVKHELPENLGYYSCTSITNVGFCH